MNPRSKHDPLRGARVIARTPLLYARGADAAVDRPAHVRAGSALVALPGGRLVVFQDDACFIAIIDPKTITERSPTGHVDDVPFDGEGGVRQFDDTRGNKHRKLDLEAAFAVRGASAGGPTLVALGSGSAPLRERFVLVDDVDAASPRVTIVEAPELYAAMRADESFAGSELNVEGACVVGEDLLLFQRGNGAPSASRGPRDATARVTLAPLLAYLRAGALKASPPLRDVVAWDLGRVDERPLTFTDGAITPRGVIAFLACAEDSPDATKDGPVTAVAMGCLDDRARTCELGLIVDERGAPLLDKAEGLAFDPDDPSRAFVVTDRDAPDAPSELLELRLGEAWS